MIDGAGYVLQRPASAGVPDGATENGSILDVMGSPKDGQQRFRLPID